LNKQGVTQVIYRAMRTSGNGHSCDVLSDKILPAGSTLNLPLRGVEKGSHKWKERRLARLHQVAPAWALRGGTNSSNRLVELCLDGNAWQV